VYVILRRRRWTILCTLALAVALGVVFTRRTTPVYRARATMLVEQSPVRAAKPEDEQGIGGLLQPTQPYSLETQVEILESRPLRMKVTDGLGRIADQALPLLSAAQVGTTDIIEVVGESTDPRVARDAANALVAEYIRASDESRNASITGARKYVEVNLESARRSLEKAENRLRAFKEQSQLADLPADRTTAINAANGIREELRNNENELNRLSSQGLVLRKQIAVQPALVPGGYTKIPNPERIRLQGEIERLRMERITLLRTLKPGEP
jgi:uncharacterized protein involved in exopolysaccharide biosynthesis